MVTRERTEYAEARVVKRFYRAPEARDFDTKFDAEHDFGFFETEDGASFLAFGTISNDEFVRQVNLYCSLTGDENGVLSDPIDVDAVMTYQAVIAIDSDKFALSNFREFERVIPVKSLSNEEQQQVRYSAKPVKEISL